MNDADQLPDGLRELVDDYLARTLDENGMARLNELLRSDPQARKYFLLYSRMNTDLHEVARARRAGQAALKRLDIVSEKIEQPAVQAARATVEKKAGTSIKPAPKLRPGIFIFGILLPALTIGFELWTGACASTFFDPLPTVWHTLLVASVPLSNFMIWSALRKGESRHVKLLSWGSGISLGVAMFYSLLFLPMMPVALILAIVGFGLLPLAPILSFFSAVSLAIDLKEIKSGKYSCGKNNCGW